MLKLVEIKKHYEQKMILDGISLEIEKGEIVSLLGPSGSGKTTLLNIMLGITKQDSGSIFFNNEDISNWDMRARGFNIVFQDYGLFPNLNAYDNIVYSLKNALSKMSKSEIDGFIDFLELGPHLRKSVHELSGGQKQRVALARTLVAKPRLLLLDEPFSALDGIIKESVKQRIKAIAKTFGLTTIVVTHDPEEALTLSDKVLVINEGKVQQFACPSSILTKPENPFIDSFILSQLRLKKSSMDALFGGLDE